MPLFIDGGRIPPRWVEKTDLLARNVHQPRSFDRYAASDCVRVALINNMPDAALEDTEIQFIRLLAAASGTISVCLSLYSLPEVQRGERAQKHISNFYCGIERLWNSHVDSVIITGTEPRYADLREEPYWHSLTEVFEWAERNTASAVLSCLAAHAGVLHCDGIPRQPLGDKLFGVFETQGVDHQLTRHATRPLHFPHSRWNEVGEQSLSTAGYSILTSSPQAGADLFVKQRKKSLFIHFQGHPEYSAETLMKEYRRDVKRFLRQERATYPAMPQGYFDAATIRLLGDFQKNALVNPQEGLMELFPEGMTGDPQSNWNSTATSLYRNWLQYVACRIDAEAALVPASHSGRADAIIVGNELT
jgi:homoserine O-succinyltransferase